MICCVHVYRSAAHGKFTRPRFISTTAGLQGADVTACAADVQDADSIDKIISEADARYPLDLVIANAGIASTDKSYTPKLVCALLLLLK